MVRFDMTSVPISKFKARCLALLETVHKTGVPLRVTRFGKPIADIVPASVPTSPDWLGSMRGSGEILGDIIGPVAPASEWEVLREVTVQRSEDSGPGREKTGRAHPERRRGHSQRKRRA